MTEAQAQEQEKIEEFIRYLDYQGYNMWILKAVRSLLSKQKLPVEYIDDDRY